MRLYTIQRPSGNVPAGALLMSTLFALPLGAWLVEQGHIDLGVCGLKQALDFPCLSCGSTRATISLLSGNLIQALRLQPLMMSIYAMIAVWGMASLGTFIADRKLILEFNKREDLLFKASLITLPLLNWAYLIWQDI